MVQNRELGQVAPKTIFIKSAITLVAISLLGFHMFSQTKLDNVSLALLLLAALPWLIPFLGLFFKSIEVLGTKVEFLENKTKEQEAEILRQKELITTLYQAALHNLTASEYRHLVNLQSDASNYKYNDFLPHEMVRLCQHEFAEEKDSGSTWKMKDRGSSPFDLHEFYQITERGRAHILLIDKLRRSASALGTQL